MNGSDSFKILFQFQLIDFVNDSKKLSERLKIDQENTDSNDINV